MKECARFRPMLGSRPGELGPDEARALEQHLAGCEGCRAFGADLAATEGLVSEALLARANARDFGPFVDQVMARVGSAHPEPFAAPAVAGYAQGKLEGGAVIGLRSWLRAHRRAVFGALVPAVAALALIVYLGQPSEPPHVAQLEVSGEGEATTVIQTSDGPVVLLAEEDQPT
jgi:anti-sigma factor RsiW